MLLCCIAAFHTEKGLVENIVRDITPEIKQYLDMDAIRSDLFQRKVIDSSTMAELTKMDKIPQRDYLLTILSRSGVEGFKKFRKALKETSSGHIGHHDILKKLEGNADFQQLRKL